MSTQRTQFGGDEEVGESVLASIGSGGSQNGASGEEMRYQSLWKEPNLLC